MQLQTHGNNTSEIEFLNISIHVLWLYVKGKEYFLSYDEYPWFQNARLSEIHDVQLLHGHHLYWPKLDVDLSIDCLEHPGKYPLTYQ
ncbi:MAG: DUF2442 domain-containing protein [bacterium]|nr:DUF2442 domain-containing protein [bacterium]